ncbi:MAG TPA: LuxR C-terminal-related transcriptional regulator, partial [Pseudobacteroides sp.]|nr:LuxR C-terminal-related transcriptional regulator [Pseudobacteroides sp.]
IFRLFVRGLRVKYYYTTSVLTLIDKGKSNKEIADILCLTISTVKTHILNIFGKLGVNRRIQAISKAKELKIIS